MSLDASNGNPSWLDPDNDPSESRVLLATAMVEALTEGRSVDFSSGKPFDRPPDDRLWDDPRVLITPHISAAADINTHKGNALFVENLKRYITGEPLENIIDWERGY